MTENQYREIQRHIIDTEVFDQGSHESYGLAWLAWLYVYKGGQSGKMPMPSAWGLSPSVAQEIANRVESVVNRFTT